MLEYFSYKKVKKHREQKAIEKQEKEREEQKEKEKEKPATSETTNDTAAVASPQIVSTPADDDPIEGTPVLDREDEKFLEQLTSATPNIAHPETEDETPPPLPPRVKTPVFDIDSDTSSVSSKTAGKDARSKPKSKGKEREPPTNDKPKRFTFSLRRKPVAPPSSSTAGLEPDHLAVPTSEAAAEQTELARVLDDLDLSAKNNRAFSLSSEGADMARRFTQVLKDLVNGVPTAYGDLVALLDDRDGVIARTFEKLPSGMKKLVAQLPEKVTSSLAPEILAVAAEAQGLNPESSKEGGLKDAAKKFLTPSNLHDLVTKPGALVGLLKGIVNALKTRFPAFIGTNVLWSLAVFLLLSMLWYCYKRGREVRLEGEAAEVAAKEGKTDDQVDGRPRVEELPDDPMLAASPAPDAVRQEANANATA
ncbi:hypothetical protein GQX73_g3782 [Xylaria multiplex]|uniref:Ring-like domain-containing protein n=1 Tax=Xylaria multiplex TaxID=323545 RepID=A0A7C8N6V7_9PEZI|nr:hypothetical protein GQX73_g3782 [Xylaria multiplex]